MQQVAIFTSPVLSTPQPLGIDCSRLWLISTCSHVSNATTMLHTNMEVDLMPSIMIQHIQQILKVSRTAANYPGISQVVLCALYVYIYIYKVVYCIWHTLE